MNRDQSFVLYKKGKDAWNEWAGQMLVQRQAWADDGTWPEGEEPPENRQQVLEWCAEASSDFTNTPFDQSYDFEEFQFPWDVDFSKCRFTGDAVFVDIDVRGNFECRNTVVECDLIMINARIGGAARFQGTTFKGEAAFDKSQFQGSVTFTQDAFLGEANFQDVQFFKNVYFSGVRFSEDVSFIAAVFHRECWFKQARFLGFTAYTNTIFYGPAYFVAASAKSGFTLKNAEFFELPNFVQANFTEAPGLEDLVIHTRERIPFTKMLFGLFFDFAPDDEDYVEDVDESQKWRSLKRLAIQAHDHRQEQEFFKQEVISRRGIQDSLGSSTVWLGIGYQLFSDFGRNLIRPLGWLLLAMVFSTVVYFIESPQKSWEIDQFPSLSCQEGNGHPAVAAFTLSARNSLLFAGGVLGEKSRQTYACLYGLQNVGKREEPVIPGVVAAYGAIHILFSAAMIFLFLLAVRNHFKIK